MTTPTFTETDVQTFFDQTTQTYLSFWDSEGVLHTGYFAHDDDEDYAAAAVRTSEVLAVEAGIAQGWERYLGDAGAMQGVERFGASAPGDEVQREYGFTAEAVRDRAREVLAATRKSTRA